jgi:hypothetical protein
MLGLIDASDRGASLDAGRLIMRLLGLARGFRDQPATLLRL